MPLIGFVFCLKSQKITYGVRILHLILKLKILVRFESAMAPPSTQVAFLILVKANLAEELPEKFNVQLYHDGCVIIVDQKSLSFLYKDKKVSINNVVSLIDTFLSHFERQSFLVPYSLSRNRNRFGLLTGLHCVLQGNFIFV